MKKLLAALCFVLSPAAVAEVTHVDVETALHSVVVKTAYPDQYRITKIGMEDPIGVIWNHQRDICEFVVSARNIGSLALMIGFQQKMPMLEGFVAHELSHCVELATLHDEGGVLAMQRLLQNPDNRFASELLSDIVAIMYWKRFHPTNANKYIGTLIGWRRAAHGDDVLHATYPSLVKALPLIPSRFDYQRAIEIRELVIPR